MWTDKSFIPSNVMIANASGHEIAMAEYCIGTMLALALNIFNVINHLEMVLGKLAWAYIYKINKQ